MSTKLNSMRVKIDQNGGRITDNVLAEAQDLQEDDETLSLLVHSSKVSSQSDILSLNSSSIDIEEDIEMATIPSVETGPIERFFELGNICISTPIRETLKNLLPKLHHTHSNMHHHLHSSQPVPFWRALLCFGMSIVTISVLASIIVAISESLISSMQLETATVGATLVAFGSEVRCNSIVL